MRLWGQRASCSIWTGPEGISERDLVTLIWHITGISVNCLFAHVTPWWWLLKLQPLVKHLQKKPPLEVGLHWVCSHVRISTKYRTVLGTEWDREKVWERAREGAATPRWCSAVLGGCGDCTWGQVGRSGSRACCMAKPERQAAELGFGGGNRQIHTVQNQTWQGSGFSSMYNLIAEV